MKNTLIAAFWLFSFFGIFTAQAQQKDAILVIINGEPATQQELEEISEQIEEIQFLSPRDAAHIYGVAGAGGAFMVKTKKSKKEPVILLNGTRVPEDSLQGTSFEKIDVIRGNQAINLYGPAARDGVWLVQAEETPQKENVLLEVKDSKGRGLRGVAVKNEREQLLATTNKCGMVVLENFSFGESVTLIGKKGSTKKIKIDNPVNSIILEN